MPLAGDGFGFMVPALTRPVALRAGGLTSGVAGHMQAAGSPIGTEWSVSGPLRPGIGGSTDPGTDMTVRIPRNPYGMTAHASSVRTPSIRNPVSRSAEDARAAGP
jgi:hypothetical protein